MSNLIRGAMLLLATAWLNDAVRADDAVHWESNLEAAKRTAAQTNRLVLVHFWAPWCGPCMRLESTVFSQPGVAREMEARYVPVKLNVDEWPATARNSFGIDRLPTDVVMTPSGRVLYKLECPKDPNQYVAQLSQVAATAQGIAVAQPPAQRTFDVGPVPATSPAAAGYPFRAPVTVVPNVPAPNVAVPNVAVPNVAVPNGAGSNIAASGRPSVISAAPGMAAVGAPSAFESQVPGARSAVSDVPPPSAFSQDRYASYAPRNPVAVAANDSRAVPSDAGGNSTASPNGPQFVKPQPNLPSGAPQLGLDGFCPVTLIERSRTAPDDPRCWIRGDPRWGAVHRGVTYLFNGPDEQKRFLANPDRYAPALGGNDAVLAFDRAKLVRGHREFGTFCESRIYLFANKETMDAFQKDPRRYVDEVRQAENPPHAAVR